jgi:hypothetical protein
VPEFQRLFTVNHHHRCYPSSALLIQFQASQVTSAFHTSIKSGIFCTLNSDASCEEIISFQSSKEGSHQVCPNSPHLDRYDQGAYNFHNLLYTTLACHWRVSVFHRALRHRRLDSFPKKGQMLHRSLPCRRCLYPVSFPHAVSVPSAPVVLSSLFFSCEIGVWRKADCSYRSVFPVIPRTRALAFLALKSRSPFLFYVVALSV